MAFGYGVVRDGGVFRSNRLLPFLLSDRPEEASMKTLSVLFLLLLSSAMVASGVWFAGKVRQGWRDAGESGESHWIITGSLLSFACFAAVVRVAYQLAGALD